MSLQSSRISLFELFCNGVLSGIMVVLISLFSAQTADSQPLSEHWGSREPAHLGSSRNSGGVCAQQGVDSSKSPLNSMQGTREGQFKTSGEIALSIDE